MALHKMSFDLPESFKQDIEEKINFLAAGELLDEEENTVSETDDGWQNEQLQAENEQLRQEKQQLQAENEQLRQEKQQLQAENEQLALEALKLLEVLKEKSVRDDSADDEADSCSDDDDEADSCSDTSATDGLPGLEVERPNLRLADLAGIEEVKEQIRLRLIEPLKNPARTRKYGLKAGGGICLYGPPGTGKTFAAKAIAGELGLPMLTISAADILDPYVGNGAKKVQILFECNLAKYPVCILFIDEMETLFRSRNSDSKGTQEIVTTFLQYMDGMKKPENTILFIGATNAPYMVDEAVLRPGRFDEKFYIGMPDYSARVQILQNCVKKIDVPWESGVVEYAAEQLEGFSGADIAGWVTKVMQTAFTRQIETISKGMVKECLRGVVPSINSEIMARIKEWETAHNLPVHDY